MKKAFFTPTFFRFLAGFCLIIIVSFASLAFFSDKSVPEDRISMPVAADIDADPSVLGLWLDRANASAASGDYAHAEAIWEALTAIVPDNPIPHGNLGRLYYLSLHDYPKAEAYFKEELVRAPQERIGYLDLYDLYTNAYRQETTAAVDIAQQALIVFPHDVDFTVLLAQAYTARHDFVRARATYHEALDIVRAEGDIVRLKVIAEELARLPQ